MDNPPDDPTLDHGLPSAAYDTLTARLDELQQSPRPAQFETWSDERLAEETSRLSDDLETFVAHSKRSSDPATCSTCGEPKPCPSLNRIVDLYS